MMSQLGRLKIKKLTKLTIMENNKKVTINVLTGQAENKEATKLTIMENNKKSP